MGSHRAVSMAALLGLVLSASEGRADPDARLASLFPLEENTATIDCALRRGAARVLVRERIHSRGSYPRAAAILCREVCSVSMRRHQESTGMPEEVVLSDDLVTRMRATLAPDRPGIPAPEVETRPIGLAAGVSWWRPAPVWIGALTLRSRATVQPSVVLPARGGDLLFSGGSVSDARDTATEGYSLSMDLFDAVYRRHLGPSGAYAGLGFSHAAGKLSIRSNGSAFQGLESRLLPKLVAGLASRLRPGWQWGLEVSKTLGALDFVDRDGGSFAFDVDEPTLALRVSADF